MHVLTRDGEWVVPPQHTVWVPPITLHAVKFVGVTTRSLYIEPACAARLRNKSRCEAIDVSTLLRQLLLEAVDLPPRYESARDRALTDLMLLALCQAFLLLPAIHDPAERWASALFMSASTFRRHFRQQTGMSFSAWRQRACLVSALTLLLTGTPVNEVALSLGYHNGASFAIMFRRVTGQPPSFYHPT